MNASLLLLAVACQAAQPDIFLITIDTLRADHVHCYGYQNIRTPALDDLANGGIRFSHAYTPSPITNSSHVSILTGLWPSSHGVTDFGVPLPAAYPTLAQTVESQGYHTAAFIGAVILDSTALAPDLDRGFEFYDNFPAAPNSKSHWGYLERRAMDVVQRSESWLAAHPTGPHFMWLHLYDPHDPYEPPPPFSITYKGRLYDGEIAYADSALAQFIQYLKRHGRYQNALIVVVGDHGEGLGEHGEDTHGIFLYDSTTHVPLILKLPGGAAAGTVVDAQVRTIDIFPTVLHVAGIPAPAKLDGESLDPYFRSDQAPPRVAFGETDYPLRFGWAPLRSVRAEGFKFIEAPRPELYRLQPDPTEMQDIYEPWNPSVQKFRGLLAERRAKARQTVISAGAVGPQTIAALSALGYLGRADAGSSTNVPAPSLLPDPKDRIEQQNLLHTAMIASTAARPSEAREALQKLLRLDPESSTALQQLGELELDAGQNAQAAEHLRRALALRPDDASVAFDAGRAMEKTRDFPGARNALEASLKLLPGQFPARLALGRVYIAMKDSRAAQDQFEAALILEPKSNEAKLWLARARASTNTAPGSPPPARR